MLIINSTNEVTIIFLTQERIDKITEISVILQQLIESNFNHSNNNSNT